jgi:uncharacterized protein (UPF0332 family)
LDEIDLQFNKALSDLKSSQINIQTEQFETSINRSYYAVFHSAVALLIKKGIHTKTHSGTISEFGKQYVHLDNFNKEIFDIFSELEELREMLTTMFLE